MYRHSKVDYSYSRLQEFVLYNFYILYCTERLPRELRTEIEFESRNDIFPFRMAEALDEQTTKELLIWIDSIELSRPKKNINRDFADGVLVAEVIHVSPLSSIHFALIHQSIFRVISHSELKNIIIFRHLVGKGN